MGDGVAVRSMRAGDIAAADRVFRRAFGTFFQAADPDSFRGDAALVGPRLHVYPDGGIVAERGGAIVGMSFASRWGSLGVLGPVAVDPALWKQGVARQLLGATIDTFARWQCRLAGLFTFPQSASHLRLYQEFGFWPRSLTPVMAKPVAAEGATVPGAVLLGTAPDRAGLVAGCRALADGAYAGLDLGREIAMVAELGLGEVVLLVEGSAVAGFAICHTGAGSEGGSQTFYVKFALVRSGAEAAQRLRRLIAACERCAAARGVGQISAGVNTARHNAYRTLLELGFRTQLTGIAMHRPFADAYDRPEVFALDDWR